MSEPSILSLYGRERCHLCEEMFEDLQPLLAETAVVLEEIDVDQDPAVRKRYGLRVPVLVAADGQVLAEALRLAHTLRGKIPGSVRRTLQLTRPDPERVAASLDAELQNFLDQIETGEADRGMAAFLGK